MEELIYREGDAYSTIPTFEPGLQTVRAEYFKKVYDDAKTLEGCCFDRNGDLYFTSTMGHSIFKIDMKTNEMSVIYTAEGVRPAAVKFDKNGRLFAACVSNEVLGGVIAMNPDGSDAEYIIKGYSCDDLVFDNAGGFYFTHFVGDFRNPIGGVYYVHPGFNKITPFCQHMCQPNGIALSKDQSVLWVTEFQAHRLHRFVLTTGRAQIPYHFTGLQGPDSCEIDDDDNLYVALPNQGRIMVFNFLGSPIGQILTPGREQGHNMFTTHPMVRPGKKELYISCMDPRAGKDDTEGSWIFKSSAFAVGNTQMVQFQ